MNVLKRLILSNTEAVADFFVGAGRLRGTVFLAAGTFGLRYQVSDVTEQLSFTRYVRIGVSQAECFLASSSIVDSVLALVGETMCDCVHPDIVNFTSLDGVNSFQQNEADAVGPLDTAELVTF